MIITNDCLAAFMYKKLDRQYDSPLIGSLFPSDEQFVKFCKNFDKYIRVEPTIGINKIPFRDLYGRTQFVTIHDDIEIHWPHEKKSEVLLEKWKRRLARITEPEFYWTDEQMFNGFSQTLKDEFMSLPSSHFSFIKEIEGYEPKSFDYNKLADYFLGKKTEIHHLEL